MPKRRSDEPILNLDLDDIQRRYIEQLPVIAAMLVDEDPFDAAGAAEDAMDLIQACLDELEEG